MKYKSGYISILTLLLLFLSIFSVVHSADQQAEKKEISSYEKSIEKNMEKSSVKKQKNNSSQKPVKFVPSEKIKADSSVFFPIDI